MTPKQIKQRRLELGLTENELAKCFHIDVKLLLAWESGAVSPLHPKLLELAFDGLKPNRAIW